MRVLVVLITFMFVACTDNPVQPTDKKDAIVINNDDIHFSYPNSIQAETLFVLNTRFPAEVTNLQAKMTGISMDMGVVPIIFKKRINNAYQAQVLVGACALDIMQWRLVITWQQDGKIKYFEQVLNVTR